MVCPWLLEVFSCSLFVDFHFLVDIADIEFLH